MYTKTAIIAACASLSSLAAASPVQVFVDQNIFTAVVSATTSPIHLTNLNANGGSFNVNDGTGFVCPDGLLCSDAGTETVFVYQPDTGNLFLKASGPGIQQVYVNADGSLAYTGAHSAVPGGVQTTPWEYVPSFVNTPGNLKFNNLDFWACDTGARSPTFAPIYKIYSAAVVHSNCISISLQTMAFTGNPPVQYN